MLITSIPHSTHQPDGALFPTHGTVLRGVVIDLTLLQKHINVTDVYKFLMYCLIRYNTGKVLTFFKINLDVI